MIPGSTIGFESNPFFNRPVYNDSGPKLFPLS